MTRSPSETRVLVVHPGAELYGSDRVMLESVDAFRERGWTVDVSLPGGGPLVDELEARGTTVHLVRTPVLRKAYLRGLGPLRLVIETLRSIPAGISLLRRRRPDVVYVSTLTAPLWILLARVLRLPVVAHVHEAEEAASRPVRIGLAAPLLLAQEIVVNSRFSTGVLASALPRLGRDSIVIYNGVPGPPSVTPPRASIDGAIRLLYLGRISERKGVLDAVDAIVELTRRGVAADLHVV
ncbi:MAG: glycosyltransferase, partial [Acidimicrobiales bacterium]|nr:glycosyltransferase [Acidimicrobiales bacterium]